MTALRIAFSALFLYFYISNMDELALGSFLFAISTDLLDGYLARRLRAASPSGAYFDVMADFFLILAAFSAFVLRGVYPFWILLIIVPMFLQFLLTSGRKKPVYDPVGKYYGAFLFVGIGATLAFPHAVTCTLTLISIVGLTVLSLVTRYIFFRK